MLMGEAPRCDWFRVEVECEHYRIGIDRRSDCARFLVLREARGLTQERVAKGLIDAQLGPAPVIQPDAGFTLSRELEVQIAVLFLQMRARLRAAEGPLS